MNKYNEEIFLPSTLWGAALQDHFMINSAIYSHKSLYIYKWGPYSSFADFYRIVFPISLETLIQIKVEVKVNIKLSYFVVILNKQFTEFDFHNLQILDFYSSNQIYGPNIHSGTPTLNRKSCARPQIFSYFFFNLSWMGFRSRTHTQDLF